MSQEARAKDMISQLKLEMNNLTRLVEAGAGLSIGEEATMNELLKQKEDLTKERDAQVLALSTNCGSCTINQTMHAKHDAITYPITVTLSTQTCLLLTLVMRPVTNCPARLGALHGPHTRSCHHVEQHWPHVSGRLATALTCQHLLVT